MGENDRFLPIANVARLMKNALSESSKISKDAKDLMQECSSEFISFITSEACDRCLQEKRKTITGEDIIWALNKLGFEPYVDSLNLYLSKHREAFRGQNKKELSDQLGMDSFENFRLVIEQHALANAQAQLMAAGIDVNSTSQLDPAFFLNDANNASQF